MVKSTKVKGASMKGHAATKPTASGKAATQAKGAKVAGAMKTMAKKC